MKLILGTHRQALLEFTQRVQRYGEPFREDVKEWLQELVRQAESGKRDSSDDALNYLRNRRGSDTPLTGWARWKREDRNIKFQAVLRWLLTRQPLWEYRMATEYFRITDTLGVYRESIVPITVIYEVDRVKRRLRIARFVDLPPVLNYYMSSYVHVSLLKIAEYFNEVK